MKVQSLIFFHQLVPKTLPSRPVNPLLGHTHSIPHGLTNQQSLMFPLLTIDVWFNSGSSSRQMDSHKDMFPVFEDYDTPSYIFMCFSLWKLGSSTSYINLRYTEVMIKGWTVLCHSFPLLFSILCNYFTFWENSDLFDNFLAMLTCLTFLLRPWYF